MKKHIWTIIALAAVFSTVSGSAYGAGDVYGWGNADYGQAGVPIMDVPFTSISGGFYHSLALLQDNTILASGLNDYGQCNVPAPNSDFNAIAAGGWHSLGLKTNGSVAAWGDNSYGQCDVPSPNSGFIALAGGYDHSLGLKADGSIVAWGRNNNGQCNVPTPNSGFIAVAAGGYHSIGLKWNGKVVLWGNNTYGQCEPPVPNAGFTAIAGGKYHTLGLKTDKTVLAWGYNDQNQCQVPAPNSDFNAISAGAYHSFALKSDGSVAVWGYNGSRQSTAPSPNSNFTAIAAGGEHCLVITAISPDIYAGNVRYNETYQQIDGFGGAGVYEPGDLMSRSYKNEVCDLLFKELGLDVLRIRNTYDTDPGGYLGDNGYNFNSTAGVVAEAKSRNPALKLELVPWSPPASLKSNGSINGGGTLARDINYNYIYNDYAKWWGDSISAFRNVGVVPDFISIQNEPDVETSYDSMKLRPVEDDEYAGYDKAFEAVYQELNSRFGSSMPKMLGPETGNLYYGAPDYINNLINQSHCYGFSVHAYDYGSYGYDNPDSLIGFMSFFGDQYDYKPMYMTEFCRLNKTPDFIDAVHLAHHIHNFLTYMRANSYYHWTLFRGYGTGGAINIKDTETYKVRDLYWYLKSYARFTDPGWTVLGSTTNLNGLLTTAFKNPAGNRLTVVVLNVSGNSVKMAMDINNFSPGISAIYRSNNAQHWLYRGTFNPGAAMIYPRDSITTISLWSGITDCEAALTAGHRLTADLGGAGDCYVNFADFAVLAEHWLETNCVGPGNCEGADFAPANGSVNMADLIYFASQWLKCNDPANPNCTHNW
jgi:O-glycosyl hydrolase